MSEFKTICYIDGVKITCGELSEIIKNKPSADIEFKTKYDIDEFYAVFGEYCYNQSEAKYTDIEDSNYFSLIGRMMFDYYMIEDYKLTYKTDSGYVTATIKKAE